MKTSVRIFAAQALRALVNLGLVGAREAARRRPAPLHARPQSASRASATIGSAPCLNASCPHTLILMNRTSGCRKHDCEPVAKSVSRVPTEITRSAAAMIAAAVPVPSRPMPPRAIGETSLSAPLPAKVSPTGMPRASANSSQLVPRFGVVHAAAGDQHRALGRREQGDCLADALGSGCAPLDSPAALAEEVARDNRTHVPGCPAAARS